ncbi:Sec14 cytosolic factor [Orchesella cincta]|uniref:Sec14 cytosolic factor n=1 Tax=Orchesella cincta TaxID=48709 RepID=A0A1D2MN99_ORCCI|nr:Sec14 cytosolic factor [Orchesella cincta]
MVVNLPKNFLMQSSMHQLELDNVQKRNIWKRVEHGLIFLVCWLFLGTWAAKQLLESVDPEEIQRYCFAVIEQGLQKTIECGSTGNVVIDMENLSYAQATHIATLRLAYVIFQGFEQYYPEIIKDIYIINAPWIFSFAFNFLKGVFAQKTMGKITIISYKEEWQAEFLKRFPRESIVPELRPPYC